MQLANEHRHSNHAPSDHESPDALKYLKNSFEISKFVTGDEYIKSLLQSICSSLKIEFAFFGTPTTKSFAHIQTKHLFAHGSIQDNIQYELKGSPCEVVLGENRLCLYENDVASEFPTDQLLIDMGIQSYIGAPILTSDKELIGILVVLDTKPMQNTSVVSSIVEFTANRIGLELTRSMAEEKLKNLNKELEKKVAEKTKEIQRSHKLLIEQNNLASLGRVISGIAHEIRNPLNFIINSQPIVKDSLDELTHQINDCSCDIFVANEKANKALKSTKKGFQLIEKHSSRIKDIMNKMLNHTYRESEFKETFNLKKLITDSFNFSYHASTMKTSNINFKFTADIDPQLKMAFTTNIQSLFINIFENSLSSLESKFKNSAEQAELNVNVSTKANTISIVIFDNGIGVSKKVQKHIFEPFFTTKSLNKGTGLGLSLVKNILDSNNGTVEIDSKESEYFKMTLHFNKYGASSDC